jgi:hypothetical protein
MRIRRPIGGRPRINFNPNTINPLGPGITGGGKPIIPKDFGFRSGPGVSQPPQLFTNGVPATPNIGMLGNPVRPGMQQSSLQIINGVKQLPDPSTVGSNMVPRPIQPSSQIGPNSPRSLPFASAVGPSMQQAAPVQPVPAMKKGGAVRGVRIALRGAKKATIY